MIVDLKDHLVEYVDEIIHQRSASKAAAAYYAVWAVFDYLDKQGLQIASVEELRCASCPRNDFEKDG